MCMWMQVFRPPNPWSMALMNVLAELHREPDMKLNLKFEIEVLCKNLGLDINVNSLVCWTILCFFVICWYIVVVCVCGKCAVQQFSDEIVEAWAIDLSLCIIIVIITVSLNSQFFFMLFFSSRNLWRLNARQQLCQSNEHCFVSVNSAYGKANLFNHVALKWHEIYFFTLSNSLKTWILF